MKTKPQFRNCLHYGIGLISLTAISVIMMIQDMMSTTGTRCKFTALASNNTTCVQ
jgi:hypothetical protein